MNDDVVKRLKNNVVCVLVFFFFKYDRSVFLDCVLWINLIVDFLCFQKCLKDEDFKNRRNPKHTG